MNLPILYENPATGWTEWITPKKKYRLACCDCGLNHDIEFYVLLAGGKKLDMRKGQIKFRLQRNKLATAAMRWEDAKNATKNIQRTHEPAGGGLGLSSNGWASTIGPQA